jgi:hypothetical protein
MKDCAGLTQAEVDLSVILGAVIGAMIRAGISAHDLRFQIEVVLKSLEVGSTP